MSLGAALKAGLRKVGGRALGIDAALLKVEKRHREALDKASDTHRLGLETVSNKHLEALEEVSKKLSKLEAAQTETLTELRAVSRLAGQLVAVHHADAAQVRAGQGDPFSLDAIEAHARHALARVPMLRDPFPYLVVPDLLPDVFYRRLLDAVPPAEYWRTGESSRENFFIGEDVAPSRSEAVWSFMQTRVAPGVLQPLFVDAFREHLHAYWRDTFNLDGARLERDYHCDEGKLLLRRPGYQLGPHLDPTHAVLTVLLYLARPGEAIEHGTDLYRSGPLPAERKGIFLPERHGIKCELATTVPFRPNTALVFMTPISVHGASLPAGSVPAGFERLAYQFQVCLSKSIRKQVLKDVSSKYDHS